jgi:hypothetical protein
MLDPLKPFHAGVVPPFDVPFVAAEGAFSGQGTFISGQRPFVCLGGLCMEERRSTEGERCKKQGGGEETGKDHGSWGVGIVDGIALGKARSEVSLTPSDNHSGAGMRVEIPRRRGNLPLDRG